MEKKFIYNGYPFTLSVQLNAIVEKCINGRREHLLTVSHLGHANYYQRVTLDGNKPLEPQIQEVEKKIKEWVDSRNNSTPVEKEFESLGFTKI